MTTKSAQNSKPNILFICSANSIRSQIAHGLLEHYYFDQFNVKSAGISASIVHPMAIKVLQEKHINIIDYQSNALTEYQDQQFDIIINLSSHAHQHISNYPPHKHYHFWDIPDPYSLPPTEKYRAFQLVRDSIETNLQRLFGQYHS